jgi:hypothetical protein
VNPHPRYSQQELDARLLAAANALRGPIDPADFIVENVVHEIDAVVSATRFTHWQTSREGTHLAKIEIRRALKKFRLPATNGLFDRAYDYVAEHY